ncbi:MAG: hypothetical protein IPN20_23265 [Haliscomenobacter sp.]|nr:hypothetical protein [Haliscomenobacter sp.]
MILSQKIFKNRVTILVKAFWPWPKYPPERIKLLVKRLDGAPKVSSLIQSILLKGLDQRTTGHSARPRKPARQRFENQKIYNL